MLIGKKIIQWSCIFFCTPKKIPGAVWYILHKPHQPWRFEWKRDFHAHQARAQPAYILNKPHKPWRFEWKRDFHLRRDEQRSPSALKKALVMLSSFWSSTAGARGGILIYIRNYLDLWRWKRQREFHYWRWSHHIKLTIPTISRMRPVLVTSNIASVITNAFIYKRD